MKIDIKARLDTMALNTALQDFSRKNDRIPIYLIMNTETRDALIKEYEGMNLTKIYGDWHRYAVYKGIPIAICEKFDYGEVDIV